MTDAVSPYAAFLDLQERGLDPAEWERELLSYGLRIVPAWPQIGFSPWGGVSINDRADAGYGDGSHRDAEG